MQLHDRLKTQAHNTIRALLVEVIGMGSDGRTRALEADSTFVPTPTLQSQAEAAANEIVDVDGAPTLNAVRLLSQAAHALDTNNTQNAVDLIYQAARLLGMMAAVSSELGGK